MTRVSCLLFIVLMAFSCSPAPSPLVVENGELVTTSGDPVVLHGVSLADPYFLREVDGRNLSSDIEELDTEWGVDVIRVPIYPELWTHHPSYLAEYVDPVVAEARDHGLYVILGWHAQGNPLTGEVDSMEWENTPPWRGNPFRPNKGLAQAALKRIVSRYQGQPHVLYSIYSEPAYISWRNWRPVAEDLVDAVRDVDSTAIAIVPGVNWGYDLSGALANPVRRPDIVYETHPYPDKGTEWQSVARQLRKEHPVFVGEWGFTEQHTDSVTTDSTELLRYGEELTAVSEELNIGWTAWIWHSEWRPPMLRSFRRYEPTRYGQFVKDKLSDPDS